MYKELLEYCRSEIQVKTIQACIDEGSYRKAAKALGRSKSSVEEILARVKGYREQALATPSTHIQGLDVPVQSPFTIKGQSTLYDAETGAAKITWVKTDKDKEKLEAEMLAVIEAMKEEIEPAKLIKQPKIKWVKDLINVYTLTDYHFGMLADCEETHEDNWDLKIAEDTMVKAFEYLIENTPEAETCFFNELGDFAHYDSMESITPMHKHLLDSDGRPYKMIRAMIRTQRRVIDMLAKKYKKVIILNAEGNHNPIASVWMRELFSELYRDNPRIEVITDPLPYYAYEHGKNMLGFHHGHLKRNNQVTDVFISNFREMYGRTELLHIHTGHQHHRELKETSTSIVEMHPTLAASDAYAARGGWKSQRAMQVITYHKEFFETARTMVRPEMLR